MSFNYNENDSYTRGSHITEEDKQSNRFMAALSYLGPLWLIPFFVARENSAYVRFHLNQGLILLVLSILTGAAAKIFNWIPFIRFITNIAFGLAGFALFILAVYGLYNALTGKAKELPYIGGFQAIS